MNQPRPLASIAPGLYRLLVSTQSADLRHYLNSAYQGLSQTQCEFAHASLRHYLSELRADRVLSISQFLVLVEEADALYRFKRVSV